MVKVLLTPWVIKKCGTPTQSTTARAAASGELLAHGVHAFTVLKVATVSISIIRTYICVLINIVPSTVRLAASHFVDLELLPLLPAAVCAPTSGG